jgi:decaprenylphospho-beta-D-ribofuranose 2-oxidase
MAYQRLDCPLMKIKNAQFSGWGNVIRKKANVCYPQSIAQLSRFLENLPPEQRKVSHLARGHGRSYGDAASADLLFCSDRISMDPELDSEKGVVRISASSSFRDLLKICAPAGWLPYTIPGTGHVTMGGALAADIHGKNHHNSSSFSNHLLDFNFIAANGSVIHCSEYKNQHIFKEFAGSMGLLGIVSDLKLKLRPISSANIIRKVIPLEDVSACLQRMQNEQAEYSVAWVDCIGRNKQNKCVLYLGEHATGTLPANINLSKGITALPCTPAFSLVSKYGMRLFNTLVWQQALRLQGKSDLQNLSSFFWPLDQINNWNRMYGRKGFYQFQCLLPADLVQSSGSNFINKIISLSEKHCCPGLAVLKFMGERSVNSGSFSFPDRGLTLALDFSGTEAPILQRRLNDLAVSQGAKIYLAKDLTLNAKQFSHMYPDQENFNKLKHELDPEGVFSSDLSRRILS